MNCRETIDSKHSFCKELGKLAYCIHEFLLNRLSCIRAQDKLQKKCLHIVDEFVYHHHMMQCKVPSHSIQLICNLYSKVQRSKDEHLQCMGKEYHQRQD